MNQKKEAEASVLVTRLGFFVIRMVKPSGINSVKFQRDKVLIINTIYSLTHFLYFWVVEPW